MQVKIFSIAFFFGIIINSYSQINFEKGYCISNEGQKTECLIRNMDWNINPTDFDYKLSENAEVQKNNLLKTKEFGIDNVSKFLRFTIKMDRSSELTQLISKEKNPIFKEETLFLRVLVEGKATLYSYKEVNLYRYFFNIDNSNVEQLVHKSYLFGKSAFELSNDSYTGLEVNNSFRQQIFNNLKHEGISLKEIENLHYSENDLKKLFIKYNNYFNPEIKQFNENIKRDYFNLNARIGITNATFSIKQVTPGFGEHWDVDLMDQGNNRFGAEFEFLLPYNKNKWALLFEPSYGFFKAEKKVKTRTTSVNYKSLDLNFGIRHYLFLSSSIKLFANTLYNFSFSKNSQISNKLGNNISYYNELSPSGNLVVGFGVNLKSKFSLEFRYGFKRSVWDYVSYESNYSSTSLIIGYNLF